MALILLGKSSCLLCGRLLLEGEPLTALPAIADTTHPLYHYFDAGFHQTCFDQWDGREAVRAAVRLSRQRWESSPEYAQLVAEFGKPGQHTKS
jgi:hypothetical protein